MLIKDAEGRYFWPGQQLSGVGGVRAMIAKKRIRRMAEVAARSAIAKMAEQAVIKGRIATLPDIATAAANSLSHAELDELQAAKQERLDALLRVTGAGRDVLRRRDVTPSKRAAALLAASSLGRTVLRQQAKR